MVAMNPLRLSIRSELRSQRLLVPRTAETSALPEAKHLIVDSVGGLKMHFLRRKNSLRKAHHGEMDSTASLCLPCVCAYPVSVLTLCLCLFFCVCAYPAFVLYGTRYPPWLCEAEETVRWARNSKSRTIGAAAAEPLPPCSTTTAAANRGA